MVEPKRKEEDEQQKTKALKEVYYNPQDTGSDRGVEKLILSEKKAGVHKITRRQVKQFRPDQQTFSIHKTARRHFMRNPSYVKWIDTHWQDGMADMQALIRDNTGPKFNMTCIAVFSKRAWAIPIRNKSGMEMLTAVKQLYMDAKPRKPCRVQTGAGKELLNNDVLQHDRQGAHR